MDKTTNPNDAPPKERHAYLRWAKARAFRELDGPNPSPAGAMASLLGDFERHPELARMVDTAVMLMLTIKSDSVVEVRRFIEGFR